MGNEERVNIGRWISALYREFQMYINNEFREYGISSSEYIYLVTLGEKDGVNLKALSRELMINQAETTRVMKRLEEKGLVRRKPCEKDGRAVIVRLTGEGRRLLPFIYEKLDLWTNLLSTEMDEDEVNEFIRVLKRMYFCCSDYINENLS